jgi:SAM-dependent methyltransferase
MPRDLYERPPRGPTRGRGRLSRRALLGLGPMPLRESDIDHRCVSDQVQMAWDRGGHEPLLRQLEPVAEVVADLADVAPGARVLDVGAGDGNVAIACARRGAEVAACDLTPTMVERGLARCGDDVGWAVADAEALPYADAVFDAVLSAFGATLAPRAELAARELVRVARPGGIVILTAWIPRGLPGRLDEIAHDLELHPAGVPSPSDWGIQAVARDRLAPSLEGIELRTRTVSLRFGDADAAFRALARALPLDPSRHGELRPEFDALLRSTNDGVAGVELPARYLIASGRRPPA